MLAGSFDTLSEAWYYAVKEIYTKGLLVNTEYGIKAKMINGMLLEIKNPVQVWHKKDPFCSPERIKFYKEQFKRESAGKHGFEYTYIDRLVNYEGFDQLKWMQEQLKSLRYESKRIQAITWIPEVDCNKKEDQPCFQRIWVYPYRNNRLDVHIHYRSWDFFKAFEANIIAFQELIKDELTGPTDFMLGSLRCIGDNVHIYEDDFQKVEEILK
ncbi:thymidylate synthase [Methanocella sp. CWC-04]|uniref:Thymidylate synthase n=1 Tax=Methanooceanicella nereidis TaxID=2052831 RepID=A0AAP2W6E7_9EURY|nr:thymidylate synthase [Methanocella sp. CWC-04]MCD1294011.1 thymidylate synthase [Methanocella sp. CWC-04]